MKIRRDVMQEMMLRQVRIEKIPWPIKKQIIEILERNEKRINEMIGVLCAKKNS